jgi:hypothetical protein
MLFKQKGGIKTPRVRILRALYTLNFLNIAGYGLTAAQRHWEHNINKDKPLSELQPIWYHNDNDIWEKGWIKPWGRGFAHVISEKQELWKPQRQIKARHE